MSNPSDHSFYYDEKTGTYRPPRTEHKPALAETNKLAKCPCCDAIGTHLWNCTLNK